ncbi:MAG: transcriptional repressor LexA [bacterium]
MSQNFKAGFVNLTPKQKAFYEALKESIKQNGQSPTVTELRTLLKFSSPRAVTQYLEALERKGLIERARYERRGIRLRESAHEDARGETVTIPVMASAGCDNVSVLAERSFDDYICIAKELLDGRNKEKIVAIRAVGNSMDEAGVNEGDYVLVEITHAVYDNDLVVAIVDNFAVIKKIEFANNAVILKPVSSDPQYKPIIVSRNFQIFGKVIDVVRRKQKGDVEIVPLYSSY